MLLVAQRTVDLPPSTVVNVSPGDEHVNIDRQNRHQSQKKRLVGGIEMLLRSVTVLNAARWL